MEDLEELAGKMDEIGEMFKTYAKILRGEVQDFTRTGYWRILCERIGRTAGVRVITEEQSREFIRLSSEKL